MRGVSVWVTIATAMAVGWAGAAQAAIRTTGQRAEQVANQPENRIANPAELAGVPIIQIELAEAPLLPPGRRSNQTRPSPASGTSSSSERDSEQAFKYRLIVQGSSDSLLRRVRQTVPDAFRTRLGSQRVIQAGLFVTREEAEAVQQQLSRLDLDTQILAIDSLSSLPRSGSSSSNSSRTGQDYQYRLVVQGSSDSLLRQVRRIVPDAFRTRIDGQRVVQAGLFVTREEAEAMQ
ncbi:MAG: hypothetical protein ACKO7W_18775, partial [Elainella sp.]